MTNFNNAPGFLKRSPAQNPPSRQNRRGIVAICVGNTFEWFDFIIFGFFAIPISNAFFPSDSPAAGLLKTFAIFGVAFFVRPLGALAAGYLADWRGRRPSFITTTILMAVGTALIAFAPTHQSAGPLAAVIVLLGRVLQGFSVGGEFGTSTALLIEFDRANRGFYSSWQFASQALTLVFATAVGATLSALLTSEQINEWGWRIPFILGSLLGPVALYLRLRVKESLEFLSSGPNRNPIREVFSQFKTSMLTSGGLVIFATVAIYTLLFVPTFAVKYLRIPLNDALLASLITGLIQVVTVPIGGALSDRFGRHFIAVIAAVLVLVTAVPLFEFVLTHPSWFHLLLFQVWVGLLVALYAGSLAALMADLFPTRVRSTGLSVSYAVPVALFGGGSPFVIEYAIQVWNIALAPSYWLTVASLFSLLALLVSHHRTRALKKLQA